MWRLISDITQINGSEVASITDIIQINGSEWASVEQFRLRKVKGPQSGT